LVNMFNPGVEGTDVEESAMQEQMDEAPVEAPVQTPNQAPGQPAQPTGLPESAE
jgi:hypothetical protein